jgi:hypothetical protein
MEKFQRTCFYAAVVLVSSEFSVEGGGLDQTFGWWWWLQIFVFKPACKNDYEELRQGGESIM